MPTPEMVAAQVGLTMGETRPEDSVLAAVSLALVEPTQVGLAAGSLARGEPAQVVPAAAVSPAAAGSAQVVLAAAGFQA